MAQHGKIPIPMKRKMVNPGAYGYQLPPYQEFNGDVLNQFGNPITKDGETRHEYNVRVAMWRRTHGRRVIPNEMERNASMEERERQIARWMANQKRGGILDLPPLEEEDYTPDYITMEDRKKKTTKSKTKRKSKKKGCGCK